MHDSLGHELSLIALRAGAFELDDGLDERQRRAASELRATAVAATEHLQEITTMLRDGDGVAIDGAVADLVGRARDLGVPISLSEFDETAEAVGDATTPIASDPRASGLTPMAAHALHRVVQEAVTNATRHAAGLPVSVRLHRTADELTVTVTNPLPATSARVAGPQSGQGLLGLHERLRLAGGTVSAGPRDGVFEVSAQLPIGARPAPARRIAPEPTGDGILPDQADPPAGPPLGLPQAERRMRRRLMATAGLPVAAFGALGAVLLGYHLLTVVNTALNPADFDRLRVGQHRDDFAGSLPRRSISSAPPVLIEPPAPADAHRRPRADRQPHPARGSDPHPACQGVVQQRDCRPDPARRGHGQDLRQHDPAPPERQEPRAGGDSRLRGGVGRQRGLIRAGPERGRKWINQRRFG